MNCGMSRKEMIVSISELFGIPYKTAENHFNYLIKSKQLYDLKCGGHVVATQATTTNRTAITTQKLLRKGDSPIVFLLRRPPRHRFRLHHHSFSSIFKRYLFRGKPREIQHLCGGRRGRATVAAAMGGGGKLGRIWTAPWRIVAAAARAEARWQKRRRWPRYEMNKKNS